MTKNVFIVLCDDFTFQDNIKKRSNVEIISKSQIKKGLTFNDFNKESPTDEMVQIEIIKKIKKFRQNNGIQFLYIHLPFELDLYSVMSNLQTILHSSENAICYHLLHSDDTTPTQDYTTLFKSISKL